MISYWIEKATFSVKLHYFLYDGVFYHIETSPLVCRANQWTGFFTTGTTAMKDLKQVTRFIFIRTLCFKK